MERQKLLFSGAIVSLLIACGEVDNNQPKTTQPRPLAVLNLAEQAVGQALATLADNYMAELSEREPNMQLLEGKLVKNLPVRTLRQSQKTAIESQQLLDALQHIDRTQLNHQEQLTAAILARELSLLIEAPKHYWLQFDVTPYQSGFVFSGLLPQALQSYPLKTQDDIEGYLGLLADVGRYVSDQLDKLKGQEQRDILLPKAAVPGVRSVFEGLRESLPVLATVVNERHSGLMSEQQNELRQGINVTLQKIVLPAIDNMLTFLGDDYLARAPQAVGLSQYPGGSDYYRFLIRRETTMALEPDEIHQRGLNHMAKIQKEMQAIRNELGFTGSMQAFHEQMRKEPRFYAKTPEEVEQRYNRYIARIEPLISDYFSVLPKAHYGVKRLDASAEQGMTFGYYQEPNALSNEGVYYYNGSSLDSRPMVWTAALIYHELIPGHHFHLARQLENSQLPKFRQRSFITAFNEGWANYAASLALEMGLLDDPYERYGWLLFDSFLTARLVLDTGMNHQSWSLEKARVYMQENTFFGELETATETLRYSTDMPAQSLAYKLGFEKMLEIRRTEEKRLGDKFDIRKFHEAMLGSGALPLPLLEQHVKWFLGKE